MEAISNLQKIMDRGGFAVSSELGPPQGTDIEVIAKKAAYLRGYVDAVNLTDNQTAIVRMSSIAAGKILVDMGLEPVIQMVCRDRNRIAMQSDLMGAYALGMRNLLCLSGDHQCFGNHPGSKNVYDMDSIQQIQMVAHMRDQQQTLSGDDIEGPFSMFIGAAANPFGDPFEYRLIRLAKKVAAGAKFIQTQCIYNMPKFREWMKQVVDAGLHEKVHIMAGVTPLKSPGMAKYMRDRVAGIDVPDELIQRIAAVPREVKGARAKEGIKMAQEMIAELKEMEGVHGIHLMAIEWEHRVPEILEGTGLLPRPGTKKKKAGKKAIRVQPAKKKAAPKKKKPAPKSKRSGDAPSGVKKAVKKKAAPGKKKTAGKPKVKPKKTAAVKKKTAKKKTKKKKK